jgi:hypothetical protein
MHELFGLKNMIKREHFENASIGWGIILNGTSGRELGLWTGSSWLRKGIGGELL